MLGLAMLQAAHELRDRAGDAVQGSSVSKPTSSEKQTGADALSVHQTEGDVGALEANSQSGMFSRLCDEHQQASTIVSELYKSTDYTLH